METVPATPALSGRCLCGGVRFELAAPPRLAGYCHCTRCQRRTGTSASAQALIDAGTLSFLQGGELLRGWRPPGGGMEKCFCRDCGAHLFSRNPDSGAFMTVRMSAFDGDPGVRPTFRQFTAYAAAWEPLPDDGLERFPEARPRQERVA